MNGTVLPWSVVVEATSEGGFFGSYGWNCCVVDDLYWYAYLTGSLHCESVAVDWHCHGLTCGPENTGPPFGWSKIVIREPLPSGSVAWSAFGPSARSVSRPS